MMAVRRSMFAAAAPGGPLGLSQQERLAPTASPTPPRSSFSSAAGAAGMGAIRMGAIRNAMSSAGGGNGGPKTPTPPPTPTSGSGDGSTPTPPPNPADVVGGYDLSTDPVLQQVQAQITASNAAAQSSELNQQQQSLLGYGDPALAAAVLGANDPTVQAASQNPESTLALLGRSHQQGISNFENTLDPSLEYSGAHIHGATLLDQAYQDALAQAAAKEQGDLGTITGNYDTTIANNAGTLDQAISDAYDRAIAAAATNPPAPTAPVSPTAAASAIIKRFHPTPAELAKARTALRNFHAAAATPFLGELRKAGF